MFKIIIKRSEIIKAQNLFSKGKLTKRIINNEEYWIEKTSDTIYIWPAWDGYSSKKDGWVSSIVDIEEIIKDIESRLLGSKSTDNLIIEIDETK